MNKTEALERLGALESEARALRKIIAAPEPASSLLTKPRPGSRATYFGVTGGATRALCSKEYNANSPDPNDYLHGNIFTDSATASAYADAIETMLLLRHQPGTISVSFSGDCEHVIGLLGGTARDLQICVYQPPSDATRAEKISPSFVNVKDARNAVKAVGADRIMAMFRTLHHIE